MMAVVVSAGTLLSPDVAWNPAPSDGSLRLYDRYYYDYATLYRTQPNVRTCVDFISRNIAQLGLHVFRRLSETDRQRLRDHPLAQLLARPLPPEFKVTRYRLIESLLGDLGIYFNGYWLKVQMPGGPMGLLRIPPPYVQVEGGLAPSLYRLELGRESREIAPEQIVHFRGYNAESCIAGLSPLETLRRVLAEEHAMGDYREGFWRNSARINGVIERPAEAPEWSETARERFRAELQALYSGADNSGRTAILEEGMQFKPQAFNPQESEYVGGRKLTREECARAYHIPLPLVGILDHATYSNIREQHRHLYQDCLGPWLSMIEGDVELQLLGDFGDTRDVYVEFNIAEKLQGSFEEQTTAFQSAVGAPYMTRNEARGRQNLPSVPGGDALVTPLNVIEGGQASPRDSAPEGRSAVGGQRSGGAKAFDDRSTVWVGMYLPLEIAELLTIEGGEAPEALHMTVLMMDPQPEDRQERLGQIVERWVESAPSLRATVSGVGRFTAGNGSDMQAFYASVDAPGLPEWRSQLVGMLAEDGFDLDMTHGFTPHITLAYLPAGAPNPVDAVPPMEFVFDKLSMSFGDVRRDYLLTREVKSRADTQVRPYRKPGAKAARIDASLPRLRARHEEKWREVLAAYFRRQGRVMASRAGGGSASIESIWSDPERWDRELYEDLYRMNVATATVWGRNLVEQVEGELDEERMLPWLSENARVASEEINGRTSTEVAGKLLDGDALEGLRHVFEVAATAWAAQIAVSKVTTASNFGAQEGARQVGFRTKTWVVNSGNPRSAHAAMGGETVAMGERFSNGQLWPGDPAGGADNNANCFPGDAVVSAQRIQRAYRRWYEGDLVQMTTSRGHKLTATPNHPVLTALGWRPLHLLAEGDYVISRLGHEEVSPVDPDVDHVNTAISKVFDLLAISGLTQRIAGVMEQFHGDGQHGYVDVVAINGQLGRAVKATLTQPLGQEEFALANVSQRPLVREGALGHLSISTALASHGSMGGLSQPITLGRGEVLHAEGLGLAVTPQSDARLDESAPDGAAITPDAPGDGLFGLSGEIAADQVISIERVAFSGHVYNLQTESGMYIANGIIAHNCQCGVAFGR